MLIERLAASEAGDDVLLLWNRCEADLPPGDDPIGLNELRQRHLHPGSDLQRSDWFVARDDAGRAAGLAGVERFFVGANRHLAECEIFVDPSLRRRGIARRLLAAVLDLADADQRASLVGWAPTTQACAGFWTTMGLRQRYVERVVRADLDQTDALLMRRWIDDDDADAKRFELVFWRGVCPELYRTHYADAETGLNDAPTGDLDIEDWKFDPTYMLERDRVWLDSGHEPWVLLALEPSTDAVAAVTEILVNEHRPTRAEQWTTVVLPSYRGLGLGRLLKATMFERLRADRREVRYLDSWNADSNATILAINEQMGFLPFREFAAWQGEAASVRRRLGSTDRA